MRLNHEYWCEPECIWQTNSINKTAKSDRLDSWASRHWRGIELVFKSLDCFTVRPIFSTRLITRMKRGFFFFGGGGGAQLQCTYYLVLYTNLKAAEGILTFQTSLLFFSCQRNGHCIKYTIIQNIQWLVVPLSQILTLKVRGPSYLGWTRSISWVLMSWLLTSSGHQQP